MLRKPGSSSPGNLGYSTPSKGSNLMEGSLSPISCLGARPLPTAPVPRVKLPGFGVCPGGAAGRSSEATAPKATAGQTRGRRQEPGLRAWRTRECVPRAICSPASPSPGHRCGRACAPSCPSSPHGRYSRRKAAGGGRGGQGARRGAWRWAPLCSSRSRRPPAARPAAEEPRGGAASPVPGAGWRRAR